MLITSPDPGVLPLLHCSVRQPYVVHISIARPISVNIFKNIKTLSLLFSLYCEFRFVHVYPFTQFFFIFRETSLFIHSNLNQF